MKYDPGCIQPVDIAASISDLGFPATIMQEPGVGDGEVEVKVCLFVCLLKIALFCSGICYHN